MMQAIYSSFNSLRNRNPSETNGSITPTPSSPIHDNDPNDNLNGYNNPDSCPPSPPPFSPQLQRDINTEKWNIGYRNFTKIYSKYQALNVFTTVLPFYIISINIILIRSKFYIYLFKS